MSTETRQVLDLLAQGKVSADEAEKLLRALDAPAASDGDANASASAKTARWVRVTIDKNVPNGAPKREVSLRMPVSLVRAGIKLGSLIPGGAFGMAGCRDDSDARVRLKLLKINPEQIETLIAEMGDMTIDADDGKAQVRIWCE
jgi:hypothetical protein